MILLPNTEVLVTINGQTASKRTRNRVREHGPRFTVVKVDEAKNELLLRRPDSRGWFGWLPLREIKIHKLDFTVEEGETTNDSTNTGND